MQVTCHKLRVGLSKFTEGNLLLQIVEQAIEVLTMSPKQNNIFFSHANPEVPNHSCYML